MNEAQTVGLVLLVLGGFYAVRPDLLLKLQVWAQRVIMGAKYEPSQRTYTITRIIGAVIMVLGLLALTGMIE